MRPLRVLTWHVHGSYLYYLSHTPVEFYVLSKPEREAGYAGRQGHFPWGDNVFDMPVEEVKAREFDCVLYQSHRHYLEDAPAILSEAQLRLPKIFLEHDPPREHPVDTPHPVDDPEALLVHVTHFNRLMWDSRRTPTRVIPHGVPTPARVGYWGELERGIVVINNIASRGRRLGDDVYRRVREQIPLDLVGMGSEGVPGGLGEVQHDRLPAFQANYRFFFNPIRYTSLGLAVCEAMMQGMPIIGLSTTEMAVTIENGVSGYVDTDPEQLVIAMKELLKDPAEARRLGRGAQRVAEEHFNIHRFVRDWSATFAEVTGKPAGRGTMAKFVATKNS